jgi:hypothetical protein
LRCNARIALNCSSLNSEGCHGGSYCRRRVAACAVTRSRTARSGATLAPERRNDPVRILGRRSAAGDAGYSRRCQGRPTYWMRNRVVGASLCGGCRAAC